VFSLNSEGYKQPYFIHKQVSCIAEDDDYLQCCTLWCNFFYGA